jgi:hypothetical protein
MNCVIVISKEVSMDISVERWQKLSGLLKENAEVTVEAETKEEAATCEAHGMKGCSECDESDMAVKEAVEESLELLKKARALEGAWSNGRVFGKKSNSGEGKVTLGFSGIGFKS